MHRPCADGSKKPRVALQINYSLPLAATRETVPRIGRARAKIKLLDLGFLEIDVLTHDRVVLLERDLLGRRARILLGDIEEARACRAQKFYLLRYWFRHWRFTDPESL